MQKKIKTIDDLDDYHWEEITQLLYDHSTGDLVEMVIDLLEKYNPQKLIDWAKDLQEGLENWEMERNRN